MDIASSLAKSFIISSDNTHAVHPNHTEYKDNRNQDENCHEKDTWQDPYIWFHFFEFFLHRGYLSFYKNSVDAAQTSTENGVCYAEKQNLLVTNTRSSVCFAKRWNLLVPGTRSSVCFANLKMDRTRKSGPLSSS